MQRVVWARLGTRPFIVGKTFWICVSSGEITIQLSNPSRVSSHLMTLIGCSAPSDNLILLHIHRSGQGSCVRDATRCGVQAGHRILHVCRRWLHRRPPTRLCSGSWLGTDVIGTPILVEPHASAWRSCRRLAALKRVRNYLVK
jgi:hypothetical protein